MSQNLTLEVGIPGTERPVFTDETLFHIGVSGGKDSSAALIWAWYESGLPHNRIRPVMCDTENEHQWTYDHIKLLSERICPIEIVKPKLGFYELALSKHRFPSTKARFCTEVLKIFQTSDYLELLRAEGWKPISISGTRADESFDRAKLPEWDFSGNLLTYQWRPLIKWTYADVLAIHKKYDIPLNPLYAIGAKRVGCWPCIMSRKEEIRIIALKFPERIDMIRKAEQEFERRYGRYSSFFPSKTVPPRFRSKPMLANDGRVVMVCTIDDVVRWSLTGHRAKGQWDDPEPPETGELFEPEDYGPTSCNSGYCE